jgi:sirohydrochlorin cobaltochelatase
VIQAEFSDAALVLLGHGSTLDEDSGAAVFHQAAELRRRNLFAAVREAFWKQEPQVKQVLSTLAAPRVFIVPMFISEGYFSDTVIPRELGFQNVGVQAAGVQALACPTANGAHNSVLRGPESDRKIKGSDGAAPCGPGPRTTELCAPFAGDKLKLELQPNSWRVQARGSQKLIYCQPIGSHDSLAEVLMARAQEVVESFPFPRPPAAKDTTLFIAGHGTEQNQRSREAIERQTEVIRARDLYADVQAVFLEESPRIGECYELAKTKNVVVVPFFISDGLHVKKDIPVMLGEPKRIVEQRLQHGQAAWRNPTERQGKLVWYSSSVGNAPQIAEVILARVCEAAVWG